MLWSAYLVLLTIGVFFKLVESIEEVLHRETFQRIENVALENTYATVINTYSATQCCAECFLDDKCVAVNYRFETSSCDLNDKRPINDSGIIMNEDSNTDVYYLDNVIASTTQCEADWIMFDQHCYLFVAVNLIQPQSHSYCYTMNSSLVEIQSKEENDFVRSQAKSSGLVDYWLGINDIQLEGVFKWPSGAAVTFTGWPNGPNHATEFDDCVTSTLQGLWNDVMCVEKSHIVCEKGYLLN